MQGATRNTTVSLCTRVSGIDCNRRDRTVVPSVTWFHIHPLPPPPSRPPDAQPSPPPGWTVLCSSFPQRWRETLALPAKPRPPFSSSQPIRDVPSPGRRVSSGTHWVLRLFHQGDRVGNQAGEVSGRELHGFDVEGLLQVALARGKGIGVLARPQHQLEGAGATFWEGEEEQTSCHRTLRPRVPLLPHVRSQAGSSRTTGNQRASVFTFLVLRDKSPLLTHTLRRPIARRELGPG